MEVEPPPTDGPRRGSGTGSKLRTTAVPPPPPAPHPDPTLGPVVFGRRRRGGGHAYSNTLLLVSFP